MVSWNKRGWRTQATDRRQRRRAPPSRCAVHPDRAGAGLEEAEQQVGQGSLAGARRPGDGDEPAGGDDELDIHQRGRAGRWVAGGERHPAYVSSRRRGSVWPPGLLGARPGRDARVLPHHRRAGQPHTRPARRPARPGAHRDGHGIARARAGGGGGPGGAGEKHVPERRRAPWRPRRHAGRSALGDGRPAAHRAGAQQPLRQRRETRSGLVAHPGGGGARGSARRGLGLRRGAGGGAGAVAASVSQVRPRRRRRYGRPRAGARALQVARGSARGRIRAESAGPSRGTTFTVPVAGESVAPAAGHAAGPPPAADRAGPGRRASSSWTTTRRCCISSAARSRRQPTPRW